MTKKLTSRQALSRDMQRQNYFVVIPPRSADQRRSTSPRHGADSVDVEVLTAGPVREPVGRLKTNTGSLRTGDHGRELVSVQAHVSDSRQRRSRAEGRHHVNPKQSSHRVVAATALSALLAISAGLYPLSNNSQLLDLYPPKYGLADPPASSDFAVINVPQVVLLDLKRVLPGLIESFEQAFADSAEDFPDAASSLRSLKQLASVAQTSPDLLGAPVAGGGGGSEGRASRNVPVRLLLTVGELLEVVTPRLPDLPLAVLGAPQAAALNRLIHFLQLKFPSLLVNEVTLIQEATPAEVKAPEIDVAQVPIARPVQAAVVPIQTAPPDVIASPPVDPPSPEVAGESSAIPRDVSLLKPHLTTRASELPKNQIAESPIGLNKTISTVASAGQVNAVSGTLGPVTGSVSKTLNSVTRSLGGSSSESDAGSSGGG